MVLDMKQFNAMMDKSRQEEELRRIKEAPIGLVLYKTYQADKELNDMYETLLKLSGCDYHVTLRLSRGEYTWVKGHCKYHYTAA